MKKILYIGAIAIGFFVINNLAHSIYDLWSKKDVIISAQNELEAAQRENQRLKSKLQIATSSGFIEEEARNKLLLVKPGEEQIIIPPDLIATPTPEIKSDTRPNYIKWWDLFF